MRRTEFCAKKKKLGIYICFSYVWLTGFNVITEKKKLGVLYGVVTSAPSPNPSPNPSANPSSTPSSILSFEPSSIPSANPSARLITSKANTNRYWRERERKTRNV